MNARDMELLEVWYRQHGEFLFQYARQYVDYHSAQELVQEAFCAACRKGALEEIRYPRVWLRTITKNLIRNRLREQRNWRELLVGLEIRRELQPEETDIEVEYFGALREEELRLLKRLASGCTYAEAAGELGITPEACRKRAKRAGERLRRLLECPGS